MISCNVDQIFVIYFRFGDNAARKPNSSGLRTTLRDPRWLVCADVRCDYVTGKKIVECVNTASKFHNE